MSVTTDEKVPLNRESDILTVRQLTREAARQIGLSLVDQTKLITAASELARNTIDHGGGGSCVISRPQRQGRDGVRLRFEDRGPGIDDIERAMSDGYTSGGGLGLGLGGTKRLVHEFDLESSPGAGTTVTITRWR